eukprot:7660088-Alexandrium_andersonii.AAC.1
MRPRQETRERPATIDRGGSRGLGARGARASPAGAEERPTRHEMKAHEQKMVSGAPNCTRCDGRARLKAI